MKKFRASIVCQILSLMAVSLFVLPLNGGPVFAKEEIKATTEVKHKPIDYFVPEKRIELAAEVTDEAGINVVRCYFRAVEQADFVFVAMKASSPVYHGILPAPSKETETIEYLFLAVNGKNEVVKTQAFKVHKKDEDETPAWQQVSSKGDIHVTTELAQAPQVPPGFTDSIAVDIAESSARFGLVVAGLYTASQASGSGGTSGTAAAAQDAGTISAKTGGLSTLAYVGGGALLVGGVAAAAGGGGGGGGGGGDGTTTSTTTTPPTTIGPTTSTTTSEGGNGGLSDVTVDSRNVQLAFWDCGAPPCENDGDVIDARLNGFPVLFYQRLSPSETTRQVTLNAGQNTLMIIARQDGQCSGNTACLRVSNVTSGDAVQGWDLSAVGFDGQPLSASMTISAPSTSPTTTTSITTSTTTSQTTTPTTTTTTSTTTTPVTTTSTTTITDPCAGNRAPQLTSLYLYGDHSPPCVYDYLYFTGQVYNPEGQYDMKSIHVTLYSSATGYHGPYTYPAEPSGSSTQYFSLAPRTLPWGVGYVGQYCLYVQLEDQCGNFSSTRTACVYSRDCHSQTPSDPDYDY